MSNRKLYKTLNYDVAPADIPPVETAWQKMEQKLNQRRRRRIFFAIGWMMMGAVFIALTVYSGMETAARATDGLPEKMPSTRSAKWHGSGGNRLPADSLLRQGRIQRAYPLAGIDYHDNTVPHSAEKNFAAHRRQLRNLRLRRLKKGRTAGTVDTSVAVPGSGARHFVDGEPNSMESPEEKAKRDSVNLSAVSIQEHPSADKNKTDEKSQDKESEDQDKWRIGAGLQWTMQVPFSGSAQYFSGPEGKSEPYRIFYPGIWISLVSQRKMATLTWTPFASAVFGRSPYTVEDFTDPRGSGERSYTLHKVFGSSFSLGADWNWQGHWWVGGQISGMLWQKGTGTMRETINGAYTRKESYAVSAADWSGFAKFQPGLGANLMYRGARWQAGGRFTVHLVPVSDRQGEKNQTTLELFARLALWSSH